MSVEALEIKVDAPSKQAVTDLLASLTLLEDKLKQISTSTPLGGLSNMMQIAAQEAKTSAATVSDEFEKVSSKLKVTWGASLGDFKVSMRSTVKEAMAAGADIDAIANKSADLQTVLNARREAEDAKSLEKRTAEYELAAYMNQQVDEKRLAKQVADYELAAYMNQQIDEKRLAKQVADYDLAYHMNKQLDEKRLADYSQMYDLASHMDAEFNAKRTAAAELAANKQLEIKAAELERQRVLETNFQTASLAAQVATAEKAKVYASLGGDAPAKFGVSAATADIGALTAQIEATKNLGAAHTALAPAIKATAISQVFQNDVMKEAQGAFRGAAHEAGMYGIMHGQIIAMLAGGAIAAALHHIAVMGAEAEFNLKFLQTFSSDNKPLDMDKFIGITSGTLASIAEAGHGMRALAEAGFTQSQAMTALPDVLRLAALGEMSVAEAAKMAVESMHAFGMEATDISKIGDVLVAVAAKTNVSVHTLSTDMAAAATTIQMFGGTMQEAAGMVGVLAQRGLTIQPLASAMTSLYEPSNKVKEVMDKIGLSAKNLDGSLKDPMVLLGELKSKLDGFANPVDVIGSMFPVRSAKAVQAMTQDIEKLKDVVETANNSNGKMFNALVSQMDTVEGAFKAISSTVQGDMASAFTKAQPEIRAVEEALMSIAKSPAVVQFLTDLTVTVSRLSGLVLQHGKAIEYLLGAYLGFKILSSLSTTLASFALAQEATAAASLHAATAVQAEAIALNNMEVAARNAKLEAAALAVSSEASAVATTSLSSGLTAAATGARVFSAALGWIGVALAVGTVAYQAFHSTLDKSDEKHLTEQNSIKATINVYDQEIERLKNLKAQFELTGKAGVDSAAAVQLAQNQMQHLELMGQIAELSPKAKPGVYNGKDLPLSASQMAAKNQLADLYDKLNKVDEVAATLKDRQRDVSYLSAQTDFLSKKLTLEERLAKLAESAHTAKGSGAADIQAAVAKLTADKESALASDHILDTTKQVEELEKRISATKATYTKPDKAGASDAYRASVQSEESKFNQFKLEQENILRRAKAANARAEIDDILLAEVTYKTSMNIERAETAKLYAEIALAQGQPNKKAAEEKYAGKIEADKIKEARFENDLEDAKLKFISNTEKEILKVRIKGLEDQHKHVEAQALKDEETYGAMESKLTSGISHLMEKVGAGQANVLDYKLIQDYLTKLGEIGNTKAFNTITAGWKDSAQAFKFAQGNFDELANSVSKQMKLVTDQAQDRSMSAQWDAAASAEKMYADSLDGLQVALQKVKDARANGTYDPQTAPKLDLDVTNAEDKMRTLANQVRKQWEDVGKSITKSLGDAFGSTGTAIGQMMAIAQRTANTQKNLDRDVAKAKAEFVGPEYAAETAEKEQKYARESASIAIDGYADMANAAKGMFDEKSKGYQVMAGIEKAMHLASLAMNAEKIISNLATTISGMQAGASQFFAQSGWAGFAGVAAMMAVMAGLGFGGGGGGSAPAMPKNEGKGTVLGDENAQSKSIDDSISTLEANSNIALKHTQGMLAALNTIRDNIGALAAMISVTTGIRGTAADSAGINSSSSFLGLFGSTRELTGQGLMFGTEKKTTMQGEATEAENSRIEGMLYTSSSYVAQTVNQIREAGVAVQKFTEITTTSTGLLSFLSSGPSTSRELTPADKSMKDQISAIILGSVDSVIDAAVGLGGNRSKLNTQLGDKTVDLGKIDFKGMTGQQVSDELKAVFGAFSDGLAEDAVPAIKAFEHVGEGGLAALTRVLTGTEAATLALGAFGLKAIDFTDVINKKAKDIGAEIERQTIHNSEMVSHSTTANFGPMSAPELSGIGKIIDSEVTLSGSDLMALYAALKAAQAETKSFGSAINDITSDEVAGAGTVEKLTAGQSAYYKNFFSASEQLQAHTSTLTKSFSDLGMPVPATRDSFSALVEQTRKLSGGTDQAAIDAQFLLGRLLSLSPAFNDVATEADALNAAMLSSSQSYATAVAKWKGASDSELGELAISQAKVALNAGLKSGLKTSNWMISSVGEAASLTAEQLAVLTPAQVGLVNAYIDSASAANKAAEATDKKTTKEKEVLITHQLEIQQMQLLGNAEGALTLTRQDAMEALLAQHEGQEAYYRTLQESVWVLQDAATTQALRVQLLTAEGKTYEATVANRTLALSQMVQENKLIQQQINATQDAAAHRTLEIALLTAEGKTYQATQAQREIALRGLSEEDAATQKLINTATDLAKTHDLEVQIQTLLGDSSAALNATRDKELKALSDGDALLQKRIYLLQDEAKAANTALDAMKTLTDDLAKVASFKDSNASAIHNIQTDATDYNGSAYAASQVAAAQSGLSTAESGGNIDDKLAAASKLQQAFVDQYGVEKGLLDKKAEDEKTAYDATIAAQNKVIDSTNQMSDALRGIANYAEGLRLAASSPLTAAQRKIEATNTLNDLIAKTRAGDVEAAGKVTGVSDNRLQALKDTSHTSLEYTRQFLQQQILLASVGSKAQATIQQVTSDGFKISAGLAKQQVDLQSASIKALQTLQVKADVWQAQLSVRLTAQMAIFANINQSAATIAQEIATLPGQLATLLSSYMAGKTTPGQSFGSNTELNKFLALKTGYTGDFGGGGFNAFMAQHPEFNLAQLTSQFSPTSASASGSQGGGGAQLGYGGIPKLALGTNYVPADMLANIHAGERIIPAAENRMLMKRLAEPSSGDKQSAEISALRQEVAELKVIMANLLRVAQKNEDNTRRSRDILDNVTQGDDKLRTKVYT